MWSCCKKTRIRSSTEHIASSDQPICLCTVVVLTKKENLTLYHLQFLFFWLLELTWLFFWWNHFKNERSVIIFEILFSAYILCIYNNFYYNWDKVYLFLSYNIMKVLVDINNFWATWNEKSRKWTRRTQTICEPDLWIYIEIRHVINLRLHFKDLAPVISK